MIITLSPAITRLLNALHHDLELEGEWEDFQREREEVLSWLGRESAFVAPEAAADYANLRWLWEKIDLSLEREELDMESVVRPLIEAVSLQQRLRAERLHHGLAENEVVNSALLAAQAFSEGRVELETLRVWTEPLEAYLNATWERAIQVGIPSSQQGLTALEVGIRDWKAALGEGNASSEYWEAVTSWIRWGADQIEEHLVSLEPGPTAPIESLLIRLGKPGASEDSWEEESVEALHDLWLGFLDPLLLTMSTRERLEEEMETVLTRLLEAVRGKDAARRVAALDAAHQLCRVARRDHGGRAERQHAANPLLMAVSAVLSEAMPDVLLEDFLHFVEESSGTAAAGAELIRSYLADGDRTHLHRAMDRLLKSATTLPSSRNALASL